ncbi:MAG: S1 family peptidase [Myxococcota bacterium]
MHRFSFVVVAALIVGCAPFEESEERYQTHRSPIVGGTVSNADTAVVAVSVGTSEQYCTGTLIAPKTVLTAAHCVYAYGVNQPYYVLVGTYAYQPTQRVRVVSQHEHPSYDGSRHDIGVLQLEQPVSNVTPIEANPVALTSADLGRSLRHVGFGVTDPMTGGGGGVKREVTYTLRQVRSYTLESGATGKQTCGGDSGGPALMVTAGSNLERVVGVVSYGDPDCAEYGIDSRVDVDLGWVQSTSAAWEAPTCATDSKCVSGCTPVDQDCVCIADGVCSPQCQDLLRDPDCPRDCVANGVCAAQSCPQPDPDCVPEGGVCSSEAMCQSRQCVSDPQHPAYYCSRVCTQAADCPAQMECASSGVCLFPQKPEADLGELCTAADHCRAGVCTGPSNGPLRCALTCVVQADCPADHSCEGGVGGTRYCRSPHEPTSRWVTLPRASLTERAAGCATVGGGPLAALAWCALSLLRRVRRSH